MLAARIRAYQCTCASDTEKYGMTYQALSPCCRDKCLCMGVFFIRSGNREHFLELTVDLDASACPIDDKDTEPFVVELCSTRSMQRQSLFKQRFSSALMGPPKLLRDGTVVRWTVMVFPQEASLHSGVSYVMITYAKQQWCSPPFEVRARCSDWVFVSGVWDRGDEATVRQYLSKSGIVKDSAVPEKVLVVQNYAFVRFLDCAVAMRVCINNVFSNSVTDTGVPCRFLEQFSSFHPCPGWRLIPTAPCVHPVTSLTFVDFVTKSATPVYDMECTPDKVRDCCIMSTKRHEQRAMVVPSTKKVRVEEPKEKSEDWSFITAPIPAPKTAEEKYVADMSIHRACISYFELMGFICCSPTTNLLE